MSGTIPGPSERLMLGAHAPKKLVILRHGQTTHNAGGIWQGQLDTELSDVGREQARAAAQALSSVEFAGIWASDLRRASDTAQAVADVVGLPVRTDERLREINVGTWQGRSMADLQEEVPDTLDAVARGDDPRRGETGETVAEVAARALDGLHAIIDELEPGQTGLVVSHGVASRAMAAALVGIDQHAAWLGLGGLRNCHWVELSEGKYGWRIDRWNAS